LPRLLYISACIAGSGLLAPNVKHDSLSSFHRPSPVVGTSCGGVVPPHNSVRFGFDERRLGAFSGPGSGGERRREFPPPLAPLVICPPPPPSAMFDFTQHASAAAATARQYCIHARAVLGQNIWGAVPSLLSPPLTHSSSLSFPSPFPSPASSPPQQALVKF